MLRLIDCRRESRMRGRRKRVRDVEEKKQCNTSCDASESKIKMKNEIKRRRQERRKNKSEHKKNRFGGVSKRDVTQQFCSPKMRVIVRK